MPGRSSLEVRPLADARASRFTGRIVPALLGIAVAGACAHLAYTGLGLGLERWAPFFDRWLYVGVLLAVATSCALRPVVVEAARGGWACFAVAVVLWTAGEIYAACALYGLADPPYPSWADAGWVAFYLPAVTGQALLVRGRLRAFGASVLLDGLIGVLALAAIALAFVIGPVVAAAEGSVLAITTNVTYPIGDAVVVVMLISALAASAWRPGPAWSLLGLGFAVFAVSDSVYVTLVTEGGYSGGTVLDSGWMVGFVLLGLGAWAPTDPAVSAADASRGGLRLLLVPLGFVAACVVLLVMAAPLELPLGCSLLAASGLLVAAVRVAASFRELRSLSEARHQAVTDELTGLLNRRGFYARAEEELAADAGARSLLLLDLDRFKELNDTLGHQAGDELLCELARRLEAALPDVALARLGGDEFVALLPAGSDAVRAAAAARRVLAGLEEPVAVEGIVAYLGASIGIATSPDHGRTRADLLRHADIAMYRAKKQRSGVEHYVPETDHHSRDRLALVGELHAAFETGQLILHYQPKVDLATRAVRGVEALVRWEHPTRGLLYPDAFVPLAERHGLMRRLTIEVVRMALRQHRAWERAGMAMGIAVNISATNLLDARFADDVAGLLADAGAPAGALQMEITEDAVMVDPARALDVLAELSELGITFSLDDFGTGYSSLSQLKRLPVSELKIDKSFVLDMIVDRDDAVIVRSTVELARHLGLRVVAEGVETAEHWQRLSECGAHMAQGYFLTRPLPAAQLSAWLHATGSAAPRRSEPHRAV